MTKIPKRDAIFSIRAPYTAKSGKGKNKWRVCPKLQT